MEERFGKYHKISKEISFLYALTFFQFILAPISVALLTRILGAEKYGIYTLFAVLASLLTWVLQPGFSQFFISRLPAFDKSKWAQIFFSLIIFEVILLAIVITAFFLSPLRDLFLNFNKLSGYSTILLMGLGITFLGTLATMFDYYYRAKQKLNIANFMEFIRLKAWVIPLFVLFFLIGKFNIAHIFLAWGLSIVAILLAYLWLSRKEVAQFFREGWVKYEYIRNALKFGLPLVPPTIFGWIIIVNDRYILNYFTSASTVGIFSVAYSLTGILLTLGTIASGVITPYFAEAHWKDKGQYRTLLNASLKYGFLVLIPGMVGAVVLKKELVTLIAGPAYLAAAPVVLTLVFYPLFAFLVNIGNTCLMVQGKTKYVTVQYLFGLVLSFASNIFLIPRFGMQGAALSTVISFFTMGILSLYQSGCFSDFNYKFLKLPHIISSAVVMGVLISFMHPATVVWKILTVFFGGGIYFMLLVLTKVLNKNELGIVKSLFYSYFRFGGGRKVARIRASES